MAQLVAVSELSAVGMFSEVPAADLEPLAAAAFVRRLARGQILFTEGEPSDHLYVVRTGRVKVFVDSPQGDELLLTVLTAGDVLGELSVLDGEPRSAAASALDATELIALPVGEVRALLLASPEALLAAAAELATTLRRLTGATADLVFLDLPRRLAKLLLVHGDGRHVELNLTQGELASMLGVTRQSVNKTLMGLQRRGWVGSRDRTIVVLDAAALERFAAS